MSNIRDLVDTPHIIYQKYRSYWDFLLESYEGGVDYTRAYIPTRIQGSNEIQVKVNGKILNRSTRDNLFKHPKERIDEYNARLEMSYYYNFCAPIIDIYTNHLFKQPIIEDYKSIQRIVDEQRNNVDRKGGSIVEFRKEIAELAQIYGHVFVVVDMPKVETPIISLKNKIDVKAFPYFIIYSPQDVINWAVDEFGKPYWVLLKEVKDSNIDPFNYAREKALDINYRLWTKTEWKLYNKDYEEIDNGTHNVGEVPLVVYFDKQSKKYRNFLGISALADISFICRDVYNSCSELKQILRDQTFAFLAIQGDATEYDELSVGTRKGLLYPPDRNQPQYISPPSDNSEAYFKHIDRQVSKIYQLAKLEGGSAEFSGQTAVEQSGVAKAWDFNETNSSLSKKASNLQDGELKVWEMFARWEGKKEFDGNVSYPTEFSTQSVNEDLEEAEKTAKIELGKEFDLEIKRTIIKKKFPRLPEEEQKTMIKSMEDGHDKLGQKTGDRFKEKLPGFFNRTPNPGGK